MGMYKYIKEAFKSQDKVLQRERLIRWRRQPANTKIDFPTNLARARELGYRAKPGIIIARVKVKRGGHQRPQIKKGRRPKHNRQRLVLDKSYQRIAEERAQKKFLNMEVLNSYQAGKDGKHYWFEIILVDPAHPSIENDETLQWISSTKHKRRVYRGLTSEGKKNKGLRTKGKGSEKLRPSKAAAYRRKIKRHQNP